MLRRRGASLRHCVEQWHLAGLASPGRIPGHLATATDRMPQNPDDILIENPR
jgi:hypothetical protein